MADIVMDDVQMESSIEYPMEPLQRATIAFLEDLGYTSIGQSSSTSPVKIPQVIFDFAFTDSTSFNEISRVLVALAELVCVPGFGAMVFRHFRPIILDILARLIQADGVITLETWEARLSVIAEICTAEDSLWTIALSFLQSSPFLTSPLTHIPLETLPMMETARLHNLLFAYYRLAMADPTLHSRLEWPNEPLHKLRTSHPDTGVRLLAIQILGIQRRWSEAKRIEMEKQWVGDDVDAEIQVESEIVKLDVGFEMKARKIDGWLIPILESRRIKALKTAMSSFKLDSSLCNHLAPWLSTRTAVIANSLLLRSSSYSPSTLIHVATTAADAALSSIAQYIRSPVLISSPPSSGKTHLLQYLSTQLFPGQSPTNRILTIPLADTTIDVKSLIGTYISSPTKPGTFEWMEGALAKAVRAGRWVVFDDIDRASMEMLVTISGLTRSLKKGYLGRRAKLSISGRDDIEAGDGFALFATRTTRDAFTQPTFFGHQHFREVNLEAPTDEEVLAILSASFTSLPISVTTALVQIWKNLRPIIKAEGHGKARDIGLRDLEKWCARVQKNLPPQLAQLASPFSNPVFQDEVLLEATDVFMASLDTKSAEKFAKMVLIVAEGIGMDEERAIALISNRRPALEIATNQLLIGRTSTRIVTTEKRKSDNSRPFALTKPSLVLLERIAATASMGEPTLLVGETGTGKTTAVQYIAAACRKPLTVLNLSMQTESSDLLGGFKPIDASVSARSLQAKWQKLFCDTFSMGKAQNGAYLEAASKALAGRKWGRCADLWSTSARRALDKLTKSDTAVNGTESPMKKRKINPKVAKAAVQWQALLVEISEFDLHHVKMNSKLVFSFIEGPLVKAMKSGEWLLLDEVNLASQETLEAIATILEGPNASLVLTERGDVEPVERHPEFRLFACMNPATDVGKKDLPPSLRNRFTELYVPPPDDDRDALIAIVAQYLGDAAAGDKGVILDVVDMYTTLKRLSTTKEIVDGSNIAPHYSMRTLARSLSFAVETSPIFGLRRGLWEGCLMAFTMSLDIASAKRAHHVLEKYLLGPMKNARAVLSQIPSLPSGADSDDFIRFGPFWLRRGPLPPSEESRYVITSSVQAKLSDLSRVILTHRYPVLIQGPTSAGKTSAVEFLARQTGHRFVRINNHEHTDIQEYLGTYVTDPQTGNLVFQEGLLVTAVRQGHWIVLDELNLAPTDVLEALNRLLDDNRELVIPETQEVIKPHPNFILFATQNPPGLYAGRKVLSRAFRNRFLEVHFDDVPKDELETILCQRCQIAPSYAKKIVQVFEELRHRRQASRVFESKSSFATLRDLFRWAERGAVGYQQLAEDGYMLLAERARQDEDKIVIKQVLEDIMKVTINVREMYTSEETIFARLPFNSVPPTSMVWTRAMQRLFSLVALALARNEPVLLVGETGCGKTSVCEVIAEAFNQKLVGVNCHQNMETADLLGSQRPVRNRLERKAKIISTLSRYVEIDPHASEDHLADLCRDILATNPDPAMLACQQELKKLSALFEWSDGPLVHAMNDGDLLLLDEVSLADDSVLERLNSVLEPGRTLVLAEKGGNDIDAATIVAHPGFHVVATMNPGGDFGKKELSPALRNRFTEIWVPALNDREDLLQIIGQTWQHKELQSFSPLILDFYDWFVTRIGDSGGLGLRDILSWVKFADQLCSQGSLSPAQGFNHGGQLVFIDGLESLPQIAGMSTTSVAVLRSECLQKLRDLSHTAIVDTKIDMLQSKTSISIGGFAISRGNHSSDASHFRFEAPTTALNAMRVLRGCQLPKAILLEGSPGVGKTSLVAALAAVSGHYLQRINLSDQTDLIDLFGSDLPVEGGQAGEFQWRDAAFLDAMQKGDWVLLDEMNLASQTVLEGLNAVLDHRGTVYIPELGRSFDRHPDFRVFAAQNPLQQGGGRKGLPKSFLNRFTKVYLQEHTPEDLLLICGGLSNIPSEVVQTMIRFNETIRLQTMVTREIGREGSPWEFNLRDLFRWFKLLSAPNGLELSQHPIEYLKMVYLHRFRNSQDREAVERMFEKTFQQALDHTRASVFITSNLLQVGHSQVSRGEYTAIDTAISHHHLDIAESVLKSVEMGWLVILAGESSSGKQDLVRSVAQAAGKHLDEFSMHPGVDTSEILGSFEQQDFMRLASSVYKRLLMLIEQGSETGQSLSSSVKPFRNSYEALRLAHDDTRIEEFVVAAKKVATALGGNALVSIEIEQLQRMGFSSTGFTWVDGELLQAIRYGGWFLISDANLCSASVLDRLNSLCETNGVLVMSEKGSNTGTPEVITPHPQFRLFMTYDPRYGELSRAMRNRGVELYLERQEFSHISTDDGVSYSSDSVALQKHVDAIPLPINASNEANIVASSTSSRLALVRRLMTMEPSLSSSALELVNRAPLFDRDQNKTFAIPLRIDPSINPNFVSDQPDAIFRSLQLLARILRSSTSVERWITDPAHHKTILAQSAAHSKIGGTRRKVVAGQELYPFVANLRQTVVQFLSATTDATTDEIQKLEELDVFLAILIQKAMSIIFDFSSIQLLCQWLREAIQPISPLSTCLSQLDALAKTTTITRGFGQTELWHLFQNAESTELTDWRELMQTADRVDDPQLRSSLLQAMRIALASSRDQGSIAQIRSTLSGLDHAERVSIIEGDARWSNSSLIAAMEMNALASPRSADEILRIMVQDHSTSISSLSIVGVPATKSAASMWFKGTRNWLSRMWTSEALPTGPAILGQSLHLGAVLRFGSKNTLRLRDIPPSDASLKFTTDAVLHQTTVQASRQDEISQLGLQALSLIYSAFDIPTSTEGPTADLIAAAIKANQHELLPDFVKRAASSTVTPALIQLNGGGDLATIGNLWLSIAEFLFSLFVPDVPIDPAVRRLLLGDVLALKVTRLEEELSAIEAYEISTKGISDSHRRRRVAGRISAVQAQHASLGPATKRSSDAARLGAFFGEIYSYQQQIYNESTMASLISSLSTGGVGAKEMEISFQLATDAFILRLNKAYPEFEDLGNPITTALHFAKFGIRLMEQTAHMARSKADKRIAHAVSFPLVKGLPELCSPGIGLGERSAEDWLLEAVLVRSQMTSASTKAFQMPRLLNALDQVYQIWSSVRTQERLDQQDAESLYRVRKTEVEVLSDAELEAKELAELFPVYKESEDDDVIDEVSKPRVPKEKFPEILVNRFAHMITQTFGKAPTTSSLDPRSELDNLVSSCFDATLFGEDLDRCSVAFQLRHLRSRFDELSSQGTPNFYLSANEPEIRKGHSIVTRLMVRLRHLVQEWPEQMVLQHILDRCDRFLLLDLRSPVAQVLASLEQLLLHTNDWEAYANKENSLSAFQTEVSALIIEWRRLELASWMRLLDDQHEQYKSKDAEWALRLYGALVHDVVVTDNVDKHIHDILPMISTFLQTASMGHFGPRIDFLASFAQLGDNMSKHNLPGASNLSTISTVVRNVVSNAALYLGRLEQSFNDQRKTLDKAVRDFVKLASWKDINVFALKASAEKSHRHLHRNIRKFRDILQQPVAPILMDCDPIIPQDRPETHQLDLDTRLEFSLSEEAIVKRQQVAPPLTGPLARLSETLVKYQHVLDRVHSQVDDNFGSALNAMSSEIIETAAELAKATPANLTKENTKLVNNLASRKRKAYSDLLKSLKASGFSQSVPADRLASQQSSVWLAQRPLFPLDSIPSGSNLEIVKGINSYHERMSVLMITLRASLNGHNDDIASQDLERGIGYTESIYSAALKERDRLVSQFSQLAVLDNMVSILHRSQGEVLYIGSEFQSELFTAEIHASDVFKTLEEMEAAIEVHVQLRKTPSLSINLDSLKSLKAVAYDVHKSLASNNSITHKGGFAIYLRSDINNLQRFISLQDQVLFTLGELKSKHHDLSYIFDPSIDFISAMSVKIPPANQQAITSDVWSRSDDLLRSLLVLVQSVRTEKSAFDGVPLPSIQDHYRQIDRDFRISEVNSHLADIFATVSNTQTASLQLVDLGYCVSRVLPFVQELRQTFAHLLSEQIYTLRATYKLGYVVGRVVLNLAQKGFCKPQEESPTDQDGQEGDTVEGTGMGAGSGDKNVSSEIEEESQVEGLQGEEEEEQNQKDKGDKDGKDDAVEMEDDFEGALEDGEEREEEDESGDEEADHDEHAGDVDPLDPGAVDEKFWGDEEQEEKDGGDELMDQKTQETGEAELSAKEKEGKDDKDDKKDKQEPADADDDTQPPDTQQNDTQHDDTQDEADDAGDGPEDEVPAKDGQAEINVPEGDTLDLPEDIELGEEDSEDLLGEADSLSLPDDGMEDGDGPAEDNDDISMASHDDGEEIEDGPAPMEPTEDDAKDSEEAANQNLDLSAANDASAPEMAEAGKGAGGLTDTQKHDDPEITSDEVDAQESEQPEAQDGSGAASDPQQGSSTEQDQGDGPVDSKGAPIPAQSAQQSQPRSLGDILQEIRRRQDEIMQQQERVQETMDKSDAKEEAPGQVEYLYDGDEDAGMQALGTAGEEERQKLEDLNIIDEEERDESKMPHMDESEESTQDGPSNDHLINPSIKPSHDPTVGSTEKALTRSDIHDHHEGGAAVNGDADESVNGEEEAPDAKLDMDVDDAIEVDLRDATISLKSNVNDDTWRRYASLTSDLSYALCEQLRLILEPTLATRLQGDFRTGKRLNMRKIIPYIASEYTKDKIWLRRTKPSRREYQVLLSIDDSRSMAESHSVHLAYQTLALVAQALNKLEVGQISIAKFGEAVDILHSFGDAGFTDSDGARVMSSFTFDQQQTDVAALVERSLTYLSESRQQQSSSTTAPDLWQLEIIISDGVCQDHAKLRTLLRRALEERVMIVFIIVDSLQQSSTDSLEPASTRPSILSMQTVEYKNINGEMQLEMTKYLDTFPFEYFVVLRDVEALPGVLADTLRQWMARVSQSQE